jgi:hypothetical protein
MNLFRNAVADQTNTRSRSRSSQAARAQTLITRLTEQAVVDGASIAELRDARDELRCRDGSMNGHRGNIAFILSKPRTKRIFRETRRKAFSKCALLFPLFALIGPIAPPSGILSLSKHRTILLPTAAASVSAQSAAVALADARTQIAALQTSAQRQHAAQQALADSLKAQLEQRDERIRRLVAERERDDDAADDAAELSARMAAEV